MADVIAFEPQRSSHIKRLTYDPDSKNLQITFKNDASYTHAGVPPNIFAAMTRHPSAGQYYHRIIKPHYKLTERPR